MLQPVILKKIPVSTFRKNNGTVSPVTSVFHGGLVRAVPKSAAIDYGAKMNIDTDMQWSTLGRYSKVLLPRQRSFTNATGNPDGSDVPNKKIPRPTRLVTQRAKYDRTSENS
jgi:fructose/tagatose bisphosphate aldolase